MPRNVTTPGQVFALLTVIEPAGRTRWNELIWRCQCRCGRETIVQGKRLRAGSTRSCGCLINAPGKGVTHGGRYTRLYRTWQGMRRRCHNSADKDFRRYGALGVAVCPEWRNNFGAFRSWAHANGYRDDLLIDRIDPVAGYAPDNCRWLTPTESARHTRQVKLSPESAREIRAFGRAGMSHREIAYRFHVSRANVSLICEGKLWRETSL